MFDALTPFTRLFQAYLQFALEDERKRLHPLSAEIRSVCRAGALTLESRALALTVAIEGILKVAYGDLGEPPKQVAEDLDRLNAYIDKWDGPDALKVRAKSTIGAMKRGRALDRLVALVQRGVVTVRQKDIGSDTGTAALTQTPPS